MPYIPFGELGNAIRLGDPREVRWEKVITEELVIIGGTSGLIKFEMQAANRQPYIQGQQSDGGLLLVAGGGATPSSLKLFYNRVTFAVGGADRWTISDDYLEAGSSGIRAEYGSAATPTFSFLLMTDAGIFRSGTDRIGLAVGGSQMVDFGPTRVSIYNTDFLKVPIKNSTGDPSSPVNGDIYVNTVDNKARVYCDSAWHDMAAW